MKKKLMGIFIFLLLLFPKEIVFAEDTRMKICVDNWTYEVSNWGSEVDPLKLNSYDLKDVNNMSLLPNEYFVMKEAFVEAGLTTNQVDSSLAAYNNGQPVAAEIKTFLDAHKATYINSINKAALKDDKVEKKYAYPFTALGIRCTKKDKDNGKYDVMICPSDDISRIYNSANFNSVVSELKLDQNSGVFKYTISDKSDKIIDAVNGKKIGSFGGNIAVRIISAGTSKEYPSNFNIDSYNLSSNQFKNKGSVLSLSKNGVINGSLNPGERVYIEFYLKENVTNADYKPCAGSLLGYVQFSARKYEYVSNPFLSETICTDLKNKYSDIPDAYKEAYVPDCYRDKVEYFSELKGANKEKLRNKIKNNISELDELFTDNSSVGGTLNNLKCHYNPSKNKELNVDGEKYSYQIDDNKVLEKEVATKKYIYNPNNSKYWAADCTETLTVLYDQPKQVLAGAGFSYVSRIEVKRTCTPKLLKEVESLPECSYGVECYGGPPGNTHHGGPGAGPTEDFDSCIKSCDGGSYTQKCINSCYSYVYERKDANIDKMFSFVNEIKAKSLKLVNNSKNITTIRLAADGLQEGDTTPRGNKVYGDPITSNRDDGEGYDCSRSNQSCTITFPNNEEVTIPFANVLCDGVKCYRVKLNDNCGGVNQEQKAKSESDYTALIEALKDYTSTEKSEMSIIDSYLLNHAKTDLKNTKWTSDNLLIPEKTVKSGTDSIEESTGKSIKYAADATKEDVKKITVSKTYEIEIPYAYVTMINPETAEKTVRYSKQNNSAQDNEQGAVREYFTDIKSGKFNDYVSTKWKEGDTREFKAAIDSNKVGHNINVIFSTIGTLIGKDEKGKDIYTWDKVNIDCFYGVYNDIDIPPCDPPCETPDIPLPPCTPPCETPDIIKTGRQYVFRPVNLTNLFPNRAPRWNWNYTAKIGDSYTADAKKIIADIEKTGNDAYNHDPEYEFVITKENIRNIRKYNNEENRTYQTYDYMECKTIAASGIKYCVSGFMDNTDYVSKFTRDITVLGQNTNKNG